MLFFITVIWMYIRALELLNESTKDLPTEMDLKLDISIVNFRHFKLNLV